MKKISIAILIGFIIIGCSTSPQDKAESAVKSFLKENLKNPSTYKPIKFTPIDTVFQADTLKESLDKLIYRKDFLVQARQSDSSMLDFYKEYNRSSYQEHLDVMTSFKIKIDSLSQIIDNIKDQINQPNSKEDIAEYRFTHNYKHKGLDDEMIDLEIEFSLDNNFNVKRKKLAKGINGKANFDIKILSKNRDNFFIEFVIEPKFDDQTINSDGTTDLHVKAGKHYLTWTASNKNGFGVLTNPETFRKEIILEDSDKNYTYFIIDGKNYWAFPSIDEAEKDDYYTKYIIKK